MQHSSRSQQYYIFNTIQNELTDLKLKEPENTICIMMKYVITGKLLRAATQL